MSKYLSKFLQRTRSKSRLNFPRNLLTRYRSKPTRRKVNFEQTSRVDNDNIPLKSSPQIKMNHSKGLKKYFKNRSCTDQSNKDFYDCMETIQTIGDPVVINNGSYGILLRFNTVNESIAIKFIFNISTDPSDQKFSNMENELAFTYFMSENEIGPKVFDTFYYNIDYDELNSLPQLKNIFKIITTHFDNKGKTYRQLLPIKRNGKLPVEIQCIVMKSYDNDCDTVLSDININVDTKIKILNQMNELIIKQINLPLYCYDIKPGNFVVNIAQNGDVDVKMIDFGADFCTEKQIYIGYKNDEIVPHLNINFTQLLYVSNVLQLFLMFPFDSLGLNKKEKGDIMIAFFKYDLFSKFFKADWKSFIGWYIDHALDNYKKEVSDPSNNLLWYTSEEHDNDEIYNRYNLNKYYKYVVHSLSDIFNYIVFVQ